MWLLRPRPSPGLGGTGDRCSETATWIGQDCLRPHSGGRCRLRRTEADMTPLGSRTGLVTRIRRCRLDSRTVVLGVAGAVAGVLCGLLGVAGGVVIVPVLTSRRIGMARATASGTTIAAVLPISVVAAVTYAGLHNVDEPAASAIVPGAAAGVIMGSLLATRVRAPVLQPVPSGAAGDRGPLARRAAQRRHPPDRRGGARGGNAVCSGSGRGPGQWNAGQRRRHLPGSRARRGIRARAAGGSGYCAARTDPHLGHRGAHAPQNAHARAA